MSLKHLTISTTLIINFLLSSTGHAIVGGIKDTRAGVCRVQKNASSSPSQECTATKIQAKGKEAKFVLAAHCFAHDAVSLIISGKGVGNSGEQVTNKDWKVECPPFNEKGETTQNFRF